MKNFLTLFVALGLSLVLSAQTYEPANDVIVWPQTLRERLDLLLTSEVLQTSQVGLMVYDLTADAPLYTFNHRQTLRPASTMKLVTAVTALDQLPADYQLKT